MGQHSLVMADRNSSLESIEEKYLAASVHVLKMSNQRLTAL